jgi:ribosome recycling factor
MIDFKETKEKMEEISSWLKAEYAKVSAGRISPQMLDGVEVSSYGAQQPIKAVASINIEDPRTLRVAPWDKDSISNIESALRESELPLSVAVDSNGLRVSVPAMTEDNRIAITKIIKGTLEEARVRARNERQSKEKEIDTALKDGNISEDEKFRFSEELQKIVDETNKSLEEIFEIKEKDILSI